MFWTSEWLKCTGCSESFSLPLADLYVYTEGDLDLNWGNLEASPGFHPVLRRRAWCAGCNTLVLAERLPSIAEFMKAAALTRSSSKKEHGIHDDLLDLPLDEQKFLFERLTRRACPARCLLCGSTALLGIDVVDGKLHPPLVHDSCSSPLEWHGLIAGVNRRRGTVKARAYSFEGKLLAEMMI